MAAPMNSKKHAHQFTVDFVNSQFSNDIKCLSGVRSIYEEQKKRQQSLQQKLSLASSEVPSGLDKGVKEAEDARRAVKRLGDRNETLYHDIQDQTRDLVSLVQETGKLTKELHELERLSKYLSCLVHIQTLSAKIETLVHSDGLAESVDKFMELVKLYSKLQQSKCHNIIRFAKDTTMFWYKILKSKLASDFEDVLKLMKWPQIAQSMKSPTPHNPAETKAKMEHLFKQLLKLHLPDCLSSEIEHLHPKLSHMKGLHTPILPIQLMIKPLRRRFKYHFYGSKQTNDIGKPEWYFTQILNWIRDHLDFLDKIIQPLLKETGMKDVDAKMEFMVGMMLIVMEKMVTELPEVMNDDHQFSHLIDEALHFDREVRTSYGYSPSQLGSLHVLCEEQCFRKWLQIERKYATEKLDAMMSSPTAWESQYRNIADVDELKVPECGESFMTLMLTITDRYKPLPNAEQKLQFLDLQLELLEDFRVRLIQVKGTFQNPLGDCYCSILNTSHYVAEVLREWSELVFFMQLQFSRMESSEKEQDKANIDAPFGYTTVFEEIIDLYERLKNDMVKTLVNHVFVDVKARSKPYRDNRWISLPYQKDISLGLSTSACEMLLVLKDHLLEVSRLISKQLFTEFWEGIAENLNRFIFEEVILRNRFNEGGAGQLQFDMTRNLFPLFGEYSPKPENYFRLVKESCVLLNLNVGSAILLKDVLNEALHKPRKDVEKINEARAALHDVGLYKLTLDQSELVLSLRTNLNT